MQLLYHRQTKNLLVSYSPKRLGFFQAHEKRRLAGAFPRPGAFFDRRRASDP
ncbi:hypothetical protein BCL76_106177 [Streptomyces sp. CG 926]|nr:hypothetical protein BCL76_106177 [Streptomyces sp. CG 926]